MPPSIPQNKAALNNTDPQMQSSSFLDFIKADGIYHFSLRITNIFKPQGTKFPSYYKRILESWVDPHPEEDQVKTTDSAASLPFAPSCPV